MSGESTYVTLISSDGYSFIVQRSSACISGAIKRMLDPSCTSSPFHIAIDDGRNQPQHQQRANAQATQMASPNPNPTPAASRTSSESKPSRHSILSARKECIFISLGIIFTDHNHNSGLVLEKVCEYFYYNEKHKNSKDVPDIDVPAELCLELLMAADYLNGEFFPSLLSSCRAVCFASSGVRSGGTER
jgi:hypothetical protein